MKLNTLEKTNLVEQVETRILELIRDNGLTVGDSLPPELELTEGLGVSRGVVREALSRLRMLGLLDSRKKRGMIVAEPDVFGGCRQILDTAFLNETTQRDLRAMRLTLEMGIGDLLFLNKNPNDLNNLEQIVSREEKAATEKTRIKYEIEFHRTLYGISGNNLLMRFQALLEPFFEDAVKREARKGNRNRNKKSTVTHRDLLEQLQSGTVESFSKAMREHLSPHFKDLSDKDERE